MADPLIGRTAEDRMLVLVAATKLLWRLNELSGCSTTPSIPQSSAKLSGSGGEKQIFPPQRGEEAGEGVEQRIKSQYWTFPGIIAPS